MWWTAALGIKSNMASLIPVPALKIGMMESVSANLQPSVVATGVLISTLATFSVLVASYPK